MPRPAELLNELIEIARDGERFYLDAMARVGSPELQAAFHEMAQVRGRLIADLATNVEARGEAPSDHRTLWGRMREAYAKVLAAVRSDEDAVYIRELEEAEDRLLEHYRSALAQAPSERVRAVLERHLLTIEAAHDSMKELKDRTEAEE